MLQYGKKLLNFDFKSLQSEWLESLLEFPSGATRGGSHDRAKFKDSALNVVDSALCAR